MNLTISGHHLEVTPALREYVLTKLDRVTRHFDQVVDVFYVTGMDGGKIEAPAQLKRLEAALHKAAAGSSPATSPNGVARTLKTSGPGS